MSAPSSSAAAVADAARSSAAVRSLLVGRRVAEARQRERIERAKRSRFRRDDHDDDPHNDYRSSSDERPSHSEGDSDAEAEEGSQAEAPARRRPRHASTFMHGTDAPQQNPLEMLAERRAKLQAQAAPSVLPPLGAVPVSAAAAPHEEAWPAELTHAATAAMQIDDIDWEADEAPAPSSSTAAAAAAAAVTPSLSAADAESRPALHPQSSLSTQSATQPLEDADVDEEGMDRAAWHADNEEVLFGEEDDDSGHGAYMHDDQAQQHFDGAIDEDDLNVPAAAAAAAAPSVVDDPMQLNKVFLKSSSAPAAASSRDPTAAAGASSAALHGPLEISFDRVSNEAVAAEIKGRKTAARAERAQNKAERDAAKAERKKQREAGKAKGKSASAPSAAGAKRKGGAAASTPNKKQRVGDENDEEENSEDEEDDEEEQSDDDEDESDAEGQASAAAAGSRGSKGKGGAAASATKKKRASTSAIPAGQRLTKANRELLVHLQRVHLGSVLFLVALHSSPDPSLGILTDETTLARLLSVALNKVPHLRSRGFALDPRKPAVWVGAGSGAKRGRNGAAAAAAAGAASPPPTTGLRWKTSHGAAGGGAAAAASSSHAVAAESSTALPAAPEGTVFDRVQKIAYWFRTYFRCHSDRMAVPRSDKNHPLHAHDARAHAQLHNVLRCTCARRRLIRAAVRGQGLTNPWSHYKTCAALQLQRAIRSREGGFQHLVFLFAMLLRQTRVLVRLCYGVPATNYRKDMVFPEAGAREAREALDLARNDEALLGMGQIMDASFLAQFGDGEFARIDLASGGGSGGLSSSSSNAAKLAQLFGGGGGGSGGSGNSLSADVMFQLQDPRALLVLNSSIRERCECKHPFQPAGAATPRKKTARSAGSAAKERRAAAAAAAAAAASPISSPAAASSSSAAAAAAAASSPVSPAAVPGSSPTPTPTQRKKSDFLAAPSNTIDLLDSSDEDGDGKAARAAPAAPASASASASAAAPKSKAAMRGAVDFDSVARPTLSKSKSAPGASSTPARKAAAAASAAAAVPVSRARAAKSGKVRYAEKDSDEEAEGDSDGGGGGEADEEDKACGACGAKDASDSAVPILLCDGCDGAVCLRCTDPPLNAVPKGDFFCRDCIDAGKSGPSSGKKGRKKPAATAAVAASKRGSNKKKSAAAAAESDEEVLDVSPPSSSKKAPARKPRKSASAAAASASMDLTEDAPDSPLRRTSASKPTRGKSASAAAAAAAASPSAASAVSDLDFDDMMSDASRDAAAAPAPRSSSSSAAAAAAASASSSRPCKKHPFEHGYPLQWVEFYSPEERRWIHVDVFRSLFDSPLVYEHDGGLSLAYVIASRPSVDGGPALLTDVTRRYTRKWAAVAANRADESWFVQQLARYSGDCAPLDRDIENNDAADLAALHAEATSAMPTRLSEFKNHPLYCLEVFAKKFEMVYPTGPEHSRGTFVEKKKSAAGEVAASRIHLVYPRSSMHMLHTIDRWRREQRAVKDEELPYPVKVVKKLSQMSRRQREERTRLGLIPPGGEKSELYGIWQCEPWMPQAAQNGKVPRNERGHVDVWNETHVPAGCVHLKYPRLKLVCKRLGVDAADAMTGFDVKHGRSVPRFEGVVVCAEFEADVMAEWRASEARAAERVEKRRMDAICDGWRRLVRGSAVRLRVLQQVDAEGQAVMPAAAVGAAGSAGSAASLASMPYGALAVAGAANRAGGAGGAAASLNDPNHVHSFPPDSKAFDPDTGEWTAVCKCGIRQTFEEL